MKAVLFRSEERFSSFKDMLEHYKVKYVVLDFSRHEWIEYDYNDIDFVIYYPSFKYTSNHPLALYEVHDNFTYIQAMYPNLKMYPDPKIIQYYNDKYKQYLFLKAHDYPIPETYPLLSEHSIELADERLGYPMVLKNRYGAGGGSVFKIASKKELIKYYKLSTLNLFNIESARHFWNMLHQRIFYYHLIKAKQMSYPFLSPPLLAQKFVKLDRDLKTVVGHDKVIESHWRIQANKEQWKVNIDGGGIGVWSKVPQEAIDLSIKLAKDLKATWINLDLILDNGKFMITEFSPVWHHYAYREKPSFVYKEDYNITMPLEVSLNLERIIVESLLSAASKD
jgi:glutathione synthase/RimK-type ligase-like ATP-grasp enzyme